MKECTASLLSRQDVSDTCKNDRDVIDAAKTCSKKQFIEKLNVDHHQHLESLWTLKLTGPQSAGKRIEEALDEIGERENIEDRFGQLEWLCADYMEGHEIY
jgi:hypothetical protein